VQRAHAASVARATDSTVLRRLAYASTPSTVRLRAARSLAQLFADPQPLCALALDPHAPVRQRKRALEYLASFRPLDGPLALRLAEMTEQPSVPRPVRILAASVALPTRRAIDVLSAIIDDPRTRSWQRVNAATELRSLDPAAADAALHTIAYDRKTWRLIRLYASEQIESPEQNLLQLQREIQALMQRSPVLWALRLMTLDWPRQELHS